MKIIIPAVLVLIGLFSSAAFSQTVTITPKKTVHKRVRPESDYRATFTITYPKIKAANPALSKKIEAALSYEKNFEIDIKEQIESDEQWLEEADFDVIYNQNGLLCVNLFMTGSGAYPTTSNRRLVVDLKTGDVVTPENVFTDIEGLLAEIRKIQQANIREGIEELQADRDFQEVRDEIEGILKNADFKAEDLKGFAVDANGVTFSYRYGFRHAIQAMEPNGDYSLSWAELRPFIKPTGLLAGFVR